jgi:ubiquinol-cytochrome c reductase cytochrome b subunit
MLVAFLVAYPFIERRVYGIKGEWHVLQNPLEIPLRAGVMLGVWSFVLILSAAATNDILARLFVIDIEAITWFFRVAVVVVPVGLGLGIAAYSRRRLARRGTAVATSEAEVSAAYARSRRS